MKILAFDPGVTTGIAWGILDQENGFLKVGSLEVELNHRGLYSFCSIERPDILIWERFDYRNRSRAGLELVSREYIGIFHLYAQQHEVDIVEQNPREGFAYFSDNRLKKDNVFSSGKGHANDAMRHLLYWWEFGPGFKYNKTGYSR